MRLSSALLAGVLALAPAAASGQTSEPFSFSRGILALRDINVVPMDSERVLEHYTVVLEGGTVRALGPAHTTSIPRDATLIDGRGKYLMPGLADMHTHVDRADLFPLFLLSGVTTVLNMGLARPAFVTRTRYDVARGTLPGPQIFTAFMIDGPGDPGPEFVATCEADARDAVDRARLVGYDFIKVYSRLQPAIYAAVMQEAKAQKLPVVGHIPPSVGLDTSLASGQVMIAHAEEVYKTYFGGRPDEARIAPAVELIRRSGAYVTPNLSFFAELTRRTADPRAVDQELAGPGAALLPPDIRASFAAARSSRPSDRFVAELAVLRRLTRALADAGVPLLTGTDTPASGMVPGSSIDDDLEQLVGAGLTPYEALTAATRTPGRFIQQFVPGTQDFGTIAPGSRADLVVLAANPLRDLRALRRPLAVVLHGRWLDRATLLRAARVRLPTYQRVERLEAQMARLAGRRGAAAAIAYFRMAAPRADTLPESFLNTLGYNAVAAHQLEDAIALFELNTQLYPESWNAYDSLGEAYLDAGKRERAILNYRRSLALNPRNYGAIQVLKKLMGV